ncbi:MAG: hypothetical protein IPJ14_17575 [Kineosporiaceae bacterium]|nr:hypothetical protein [Kineosporiaceae bacterium]
MDLNLDLAAIAAATGSRPAGRSRSAAGSPRYEQGVRLGWLIGFLKEVDAQRRLIVDRRESQRPRAFTSIRSRGPRRCPQATGDLDGEIVAFDVVRPR